MNKTLGILLLAILPFILTGKSWGGEIEHREVKYKDLTSDGIDEKLVFSYSGTEMMLLDAVFLIYRIDPGSKAEKEVFRHEWNTQSVYNDAQGASFIVGKLRYYLDNFFDKFCFDSSQNKMCQSKCPQSAKCQEHRIKQAIAKALGEEEKERIDQVFREIFVENDMACFYYEPYPEAPQAFVWSPGLKQFIDIGYCR